MGALEPFTVDDPSRLFDPDIPTDVRPLELLSDQAILQLRHSLILGCGRNGIILKNKQRRHLCLATLLVDHERRRRGLLPAL